jgi:predicted ATP-dependent serine protease
VARVKESQSLGFQKIILPRGNLAQLEKEDLPNLEIIGAGDVKEALRRIF